MMQSGQVLELTENFRVESLQKFTVDDLLGVGPKILENFVYCM